MNLSLRRAIQIVIRADSDPARQVLFANLMQARLAVRLAYRVHGLLMGTWASALLISAYGLAYFVRISPPVMGGARILAAAEHVNARRQVARVAAWMDDGAVRCVRTRSGLSDITAAVVSLMTQTSRRHLLRTLRIVRVLDRRHGFLVACRSVAAIARYARTTTILCQDRPDAVLVSSDSNPEEVGFAAGARALGISSVFVSHAYPTPFPPPVGLQSLDPRRRGGGGGPHEEGTDHGSGGARWCRGRVGAARRWTVRALESRDRHLCPESALVDDAGGDHR